MFQVNIFDYVAYSASIQHKTITTTTTTHMQAQSCQNIFDKQMDLFANNYPYSTGNHVWQYLNFWPLFLIKSHAWDVGEKPVFPSLSIKNRFEKSNHFFVWYSKKTLKFFLLSRCLFSSADNHFISGMRRTYARRKSKRMNTDFLIRSDSKDRWNG